MPTGLAPVVDDLARRGMAVADPGTQRLELHDPITTLKHPAEETSTALVDLNQIAGVNVGELHPGLMVPPTSDGMGKGTAFPKLIESVNLFSC
jgi:hypothetical protein